jgi:isovaleryl-CoA dehydrogenase
MYTDLTFYFVTAGSDVVGMKCKAEKVDVGNILNVNNMSCTNGTSSEKLVI